MIREVQIGDQEVLEGMNLGRVTHGPFKFSREFKQGISLISVSEDQYKLGIQLQGTNWAVISPRGKVIRNASSLSLQTNLVRDLIYIQELRTFFIFESDRKEIWNISMDTLQPRLWMNNIGEISFGAGKLFRKALNGKAIAVRKTKAVVIVDINGDGSSGRAVTSNLPTNDLVQIELGGHDGDILICLDQEKNQLLSCKIKNDLKVEVVGKFSLSSFMNYRDILRNMTISPCSEYVFLHASNFSSKATLQFIISVNGSEIELCAVLDLSVEKLSYFRNSLAYLRNVGDELIFKGVTWDRQPLSTVLTFSYNKSTKEFNELKTRRKILTETGSNKLTRQGNTIYGIGEEISKLLKIT